MPLHATAQAAKPRIDKAADLPRFTYKLDAKVEDVVRSAERFAPFAAQMRKRRRVGAGRLRHRRTRRRSANCSGCSRRSTSSTAATTACCSASAQVRALQDKPADKLLSGLRLDAMARAAKAHGVGNEAYAKAVGERSGKALAPLPRDVVETGLKEAKAGAELMGEGRAIGRLREVVQPLVDGNGGQLSSDVAPALLNTRLLLTAVLPLKATLVDTYTAWLNANKVVKPDIWAARDVTLPSRRGAKPVRDRGVGQRHRHGAVRPAGGARQRRPTGAHRVRQVRPAGRRES